MRKVGFCFQYCEAVPRLSIQIPYLYTSVGLFSETSYSAGHWNGAGGRELLVVAFIPFVNWKGNYKLQRFTVHYYQLPTEWLFICVFWALSHSLFKIILLLFSHSPFGWKKNYSAAHQTFAGLSQITFMVIGWSEKKYLPAVGAFINVCRKPL